MTLEKAVKAAADAETGRKESIRNRLSPLDSQEYKREGKET